MNVVEGTHAVVTGGVTGIGWATAEREHRKYRGAQRICVYGRLYRVEAWRRRPDAALVLELAATAVTVNCVCPGFTDTDLVRRSLDTIADKTGRSRDEALGELVKLNPRKRLVRLQELAAAVMWVVGGDSASTTGRAILIFWRGEVNEQPGCQHVGEVRRRAAQQDVIATMAQDAELHDDDREAHPFEAVD